MFRKEKVLNKHLHQKELERKKDLLNKNLEYIKNRKHLISKPFMFLSADKQKRLEIKERDRLIKISSDNLKISKKIKNLMKFNSCSKNLGTFHKKLYNEVNFKEINEGRRQRSLMKINFENFNLLKKIELSTSCYKKNEFLQKERERLNKLKMVCEFPLILNKPDDPDLYNNNSQYIFQIPQKRKTLNKINKKQSKLVKSNKKNSKVKKIKKQKLMKNNHNTSTNNTNDIKSSNEMKPRFNISSLLNNNEKSQKVCRKTSFKQKKAKFDIPETPNEESQKVFRKTCFKNKETRFEVPQIPNEESQKVFRKTGYFGKSMRDSGRVEVIYHKKSKFSDVKKKKKAKSKSVKKKKLKLPKINTKQDETTPSVKIISKRKQSEQLINEINNQEENINNKIPEIPNEDILNSESNDSLEDIFNNAPEIEESSKTQSKKTITDDDNKENTKFNSNFQKNFTKFYTKKEYLK